MAQIAIPLVIVGVLYLISNDKKNEEFTNPLELASISKDPNGDKLLNDDNTDFYNNVDPTSLAVNNEGNYSQYQDKYLLKNKKKMEGGDNTFKSLSGNTITNNDLNHNNMQIFYNNKSNGASYTNDNRLDNHSGSGSLSIEKKEISSFFKPAQSQNVYGSQNQSDFMQSRVNESLRHANTKPWAEIKDSAGTLGFNSSVVDRDKWMPKKVDELRTTNNPKSNYNVNYQPPAYKPSAVDRNSDIHKINMVKKKPDTYHMNVGVGGMGPAIGEYKPTQFSEQMLTEENREDTSVSYFGAKSASENQTYVQGQTNEPHRVELPTNSFTNLTSNNIYPVSNQNYGKDSYKANQDRSGAGYFGNLQGTFMQNIVNPLVKGLKHTKKSNNENLNLTNHLNLSGPIQPMINNTKHLSVTNREMTGEKVGMNYLNLERQTPNGYINSNPYLPHTQRESTSSNHMGIATSMLPMGKSYDAEYNQRKFEKPTVQRTAVGNMSLFNAETNVAITGREACNVRGTPIFVPNATPHHGQMGSNTIQPQKYNNINDTYNHPDMLQAFKNNPYTQPLNSVA
uniref:Uncharacterized protein n=1 Tax=viral metagenome TaxID=1070528 RepID=A0A6C0ETB9_9ZZZZ